MKLREPVSDDIFSSVLRLGCYVFTTWIFVMNGHISMLQARLVLWHNRKSLWHNCLGCCLDSLIWVSLRNLWASTLVKLNQSCSSEQLQEMARIQACLRALMVRFLCNVLSRYLDNSMQPWVRVLLRRGVRRHGLRFPREPSGLLIANQD